MIEDLIRSYYAAYNGLDVAALESLLDPAVVLVSATGTQEGRSAYFATYDYMTRNFIDLMEPQEIAVEGDTAVVRIRDTLTARTSIPDFLGHAITEGQTMILDLQGCYTVSGGKIARIEIEMAA